MLARTLGPNVTHAVDWELADAFEYWNSRVISSIPQDKLLVYNPKEGWGPLCEFLGLPEPKIPFPHVNKREDMLTEVLHKQLKRGIMFDRIALYAFFVTPIILLACLIVGVSIYIAWSELSN